MRAVLRTIVAGCATLCAATAVAQAVPQESPVQAQAHTQPWEYGAIFQGGKGLTEDRDDFTFFMAGAHLGKVLTPQIGHGLLRGNAEYAVEVFPYWQSNTPTFQRQTCNATGVTNVISCSTPYTVGGTFHGVSVTPIILRWNFTSGRKGWVKENAGNGSNNRYERITPNRAPY